MWIVRGIALGGHAYSDEVMDKHLEQRSADWVFFKWYTEHNIESYYVRVDEADSFADLSAN